MSDTNDTALAEALAKRAAKKAEKEAKAATKPAVAPKPKAPKAPEADAPINTQAPADAPAPDTSKGNEDKPKGEVNTEFTVETVKKLIKQAGEAAGTGENSRPLAASVMVRAASQLTEFENKKEHDDKAKEYYGIFHKGFARMKPLSVVNEKSLKVQISKFKVFIRLGTTAGIDGVAVFYEALEAIKEVSAEPGSPLSPVAYDNLISIARAQIRDAAKGQLTREEMKDIIRKEASDDKTALEKLVAAIKTLEKLASEVDLVNSPVEDVYHTLKDWAKENGAVFKDKNETKAELSVKKMTQAEKLAFVAQLKAEGFAA